MSQGVIRTIRGCRALHSLDFVGWLASQQDYCPMSEFADRDCDNETTKTGEGHGVWGKMVERCRDVEMSRTNAVQGVSWAQVHVNNSRSAQLDSQTCTLKDVAADEVEEG